MNKSLLLGPVCACAFGLATTSTSWAAPITVTANRVFSRASDDTGSIVSDTSTSTIIPSSETLTATEGNSSSTTVLNYYGSEYSTTFSWDAEISIDNTGGLSTVGCCDFADSFNHYLLFTPDTDATYSISGFYDMVGPSGATVYFEVWLHSAEDAYLFNQTSESRSTANESFVVGVAGGGDYSNTDIGTVTGTLIAGRNYAFSYQSWIQALDANGLETEVAAYAISNVTLNITAVPIPAAVWLFGSGMLGLIGISQHKQVAQQHKT